MSDVAEAQVPENEVEVEEVEAEETEATEASETETETESSEFTLQDVKRRFFGNSQLEEAETYIEKVTSVCPEDLLRSNFDPETEEIDEGHGLCVVPINKREGGETKVIGVTIAKVPEFETIFQDEKGKLFVVDGVQDLVMAKVANAVRPGKDDKGIPEKVEIPKTVEEFITTQRRGESLKVYNKIALIYVKAMRKKAENMDFLTPVILRQCLQSVAFAKDMFPKIPQPAWEKLLGIMIAKTKKNADDPAIMESWLKTREEHVISTESDEESFEEALASLE